MRWTYLILFFALESGKVTVYPQNPSQIRRQDTLQGQFVNYDENQHNEEESNDLEKEPVPVVITGKLDL